MVSIFFLVGSCRAGARCLFADFLVSMFSLPHTSYFILDLILILFLPVQMRATFLGERKGKNLC